MDATFNHRIMYEDYCICQDRHTWAVAISEAIVGHNKKLAVDESAEDSECKVPRVLQ